jgi:hypothetical protein
MVIKGVMVHDHVKSGMNRIKNERSMATFRFLFEMDPKSRSRIRSGSILGSRVRLLPSIVEQIFK